MLRLLSIALLVTACTGTPAAMTDELARLDEEIDTLAGLAHAHHDAVARADTKAELAVQESAYAEQIMDCHHALADTMGALAGCTDMHEGSGPMDHEMAGMSWLLDDLEQELTAHVRAMRAAADVTSAHAEEDRHRAAMDALVDAMDRAHEALMVHDGHLRCSGAPAP